MSYYPPYIDSSGLHMPTYEERLSALTESYRAIFGQASELSESVPDYQLLSVFARSLDDASMLVQNALHQMNPQYASGAALDLLLPQYGLHRETGESDASARSRLLSVLAVNDRTMEQRILDEIYAVPHVGEAALFINDTDTTDDKGIPPHSICPVVYNGSLQKLAEAIFRSKPPGLSTYGSSTKQVVDENGVSHDVHIQRPDMSFITFSIFVNPLEGLDDATLFAVSLGLQAFCNQLKIGESLIVPSVYGVCYAAAGKKADTFAITDLCATAVAAGGTTRIRVPATWKTKLDAWIETIRFNLNDGQSGQWFTFNEQGEREYIPAG